MIFKNCFSSNTFPDVWEKANVIPVHKKSDKQALKNYRPVSLLPICGKIFEKLLFNALYSFFEDHKLLNPCQSGFKKNDSCINQLVSITHEIYSAFDCNPSLEVRGVFLDLSKAFDKVWHDSLIYKLKSLGISGSLLKLIQNYLDNRLQKVLLNGQTSEWKPVKAGVPQGSILGPLFFFIYINDICSNLSTNVKLFGGDTSLFSIVNDANKSFQNLSNDLCVISNWAYQWKMSFNPDRSKQAQEVIFSRKTSSQSHPVLTFDNSPVTETTHHKHLGLILDAKLNFKEHLKEKMSKAYKGIAVLRKLQNIIPRNSLLIIYKSFIRPHLDYGDIIYDQPNKGSFCQKIESILYQAAVAITGAIHGTSQTKLYKELGIESMKLRQWFRRLCYFFKIQSSGLPQYLNDLIPKPSLRYSTRFSPLPNFKARTELFRNSCFPYTVNEWNNLDNIINSSESYSVFRKKMLNLIRPKCNDTYGIYNPTGLKLLTRLRLGLSNLNDHKFNHNFKDCINPLCSCSLSVGNNVHFFLHCRHFSLQRQTLMNNIKSIDKDIINETDSDLVNILLFGSSKYQYHIISKILSFSIDFILNTERFSGQLS